MRIFLCLISFLITACAKLPGVNTNTETYSYHFDVNGCDTGKRVFNDRVSMCNELKNDAANYHCAYNERYAKFSSECYDMSWSVVDPNM